VAKFQHLRPAAALWNPVQREASPWDPANQGRAVPGPLPNGSVEKLGIAFTTAQRTIERLERLGIVQPAEEPRNTTAFIVRKRCSTSFLKNQQSWRRAKIGLLSVLPRASNKQLKTQKVIQWPVPSGVFSARTGHS